MALERLRKSTKRNKQPSGNIIGQMRDERSAPYSDGSQKGAGSDRTPENARLICELPSRPAESSNVFPVDRRPKTAVYSTSPNSIVHSREFAFHIGQNQPEPGFASVKINLNRALASDKTYPACIRSGQARPRPRPLQPSPVPNSIHCCQPYRRLSVIGTQRQGWQQPRRRCQRAGPCNESPTGRKFFVD